MKPENYPLPWNAELDCPYYEINMYCIFKFEGYAEWQSGKRMAEIIPAIDTALAMFTRDTPASAPWRASP